MSSPSRPSVPVVGLFRSPVTLGLLAAAVFYRLLDLWPWHRELAVRYFCGHPLEYATTVLFFVGLASLVLKTLRLRRERRALGLLDPAESVVLQAGGPVERAERLKSLVEERGEPVRSSLLGRRVLDVCDFVLGRNAADGLEEHLKYLGELAAEHSHRSYALVRTITWAVPILGFLGTVVGITLAIAKVTPEQLDTSLNQVTAGLAVAFDTTALALALSLLLVFASFVVERGEQKLLADVEDFALRRLLSLFPPEPPTVGRQLLDAERRAAETLLAGTQRLLEKQTRAWTDGLEQLRQRWLQDADSQRERLQNELVQGFAQQVGQLAASLSELQRQTAEAAERTQRELKQSLDQWQAELRQSGQWLQQLDARLTQQAERLLALTEQTGQLAQLQETLDRNLQSVRAAELLEQTLHSLTAAVHLLTARSQTAAGAAPARQPTVVAPEPSGHESVVGAGPVASLPSCPSKDTESRAA